MTRRRVTSAIGALTTLAVVALTFQFTSGSGFTPLSAGAANVNFSCAGVGGDVAGTVAGAPKSSADLVGLLGSLGGSGGLTLPIGVSANAPAKVTKGSAPFNVDFGVSLVFDPALAVQVETLLKKTTLDLKNATFTILADNVGQTVTGTLPDQTINVRAAATSSFSTTINPTNPGRIRYRVLGVNLSVGINGSVPGTAEIGTLTLTCNSVGDNIIGSTQVQVPGAPNVADLRYQGHWGINFFKLLDGQAITPDDGNPVLPETLQMTSPIPMSHGLAATKDGWLAMLLGYQGYTDDVQMNVCAPARPVPAEPGANETYELGFPEFYREHQGNVHLLGFKLALDGKVVNKLVSTSNFRNPLTGVVSPTDISTNPLLMGDPNYFEFVRPSAAKIKAAIELETGPNTVSVTDGPQTDPQKPAPFLIQFVGPLAEQNAPDVTIGKWYTTFPHETGEQIFAMATALSNGGPPKPPVDVNVITADLLSGRITFDKYGTLLGQAFNDALMQGILGGIDISAALATIDSLFPKGPAVKLTEAARATIPPTTTGPLCTPFAVNVVTPAVPANIVAFFTALANGTFQAQVAGKSQCTKRVKVTTRVRSKGKVRRVTRYVTKAVPCPKKRR